jgi:diacylglycerol kinase
MPDRSFASALADATDGLVASLRSQRNLQIQAVVVIAVIVAAALLRFDLFRWAVLMLTIGTVLTAELFNTALEHTVDCAAPEENEHARKAKHAGAAAVLVASLAAVVVGSILFGTALWHRW